MILRGRESCEIKVVWTGRSTTAGVRNYGHHEVAVAGKPVISAGAGHVFGDDPSRHTPQDLMVSSLAACHMVSYLGLCEEASIHVSSYVDHATALLSGSTMAGGHIREVWLRPAVVVRCETDVPLALRLHDIAHHMCVVANSVNFQINCRARVQPELLNSLTVGGI